MGSFLDWASRTTTACNTTRGHVGMGGPSCCPRPQWSLWSHIQSVPPLMPQWCLYCASALLPQGAMLKWVTCVTTWDHVEARDPRATESHEWVSGPADTAQGLWLISATYITIEVHADNHGPELGLKQVGVRELVPPNSTPFRPSNGFPQLMAFLALMQMGKTHPSSGIWLLGIWPRYSEYMSNTKWTSVCFWRGSHRRGMDMGRLWGEQNQGTWCEIPKKKISKNKLNF